MRPAGAARQTLQPELVPPQERAQAISFGAVNQNLARGGRPSDRRYRARGDQRRHRVPNQPRHIRSRRQCCHTCRSCNMSPMGQAARPRLPNGSTRTVVMPTMLALSTKSAPWAGTHISGRAGPTNRAGRPFLPSRHQTSGYERRPQQNSPHSTERIVGDRSDRVAARLAVTFCDWPCSWRTLAEPPYARGRGLPCSQLWAARSG
jgi:hypothetical protein